MITIGHVKKDSGVYVGRPSPLGNPFVIGRDGTRSQVIEKYRQWFVLQMTKNSPARKAVNNLVKQYREDGELCLTCWCAPYACHAQVIRDFILEETS